MKSSLTLSLDREIVQKANNYAKINKQSLSQLVETYFNTLVSVKGQVLEFSPIVKELSGIVEIPDGLTD